MTGFKKNYIEIDSLTDVFHFHSLIHSKHYSKEALVNRQHSYVWTLLSAEPLAVYQKVKDIIIWRNTFSMKSPAKWRRASWPYDCAQRVCLTDTHLKHSSLADVDQTQQDSVETEEDIVSADGVNAIRVDRQELLLQAAHSWPLTLDTLHSRATVTHTVLPTSTGIQTVNLEI